MGTITGTVGETICEGGTYAVTLDALPGAGPFDLTINGNTFTNIADGGTVMLTEGLDFSGDAALITLTSITDTNNGNIDCTTAGLASVVVGPTVNEVDGGRIEAQDDPICSGESNTIISVDDGTTDLLDSNPAVDYSWALDIDGAGFVLINGETSSTLNTGTIDNLSGAAVTHTYQRTTTSSVNSVDCSESVTTSLTISPKPVIDPISNPTAACSGDNLNIVVSDNTTSPSTIYSYSGGGAAGIPDGTVVGSGSLITGTAVTNTTGSDITATIVVTASLNGCAYSDSESFVVTVKPTPVINTIANPAAVCPGALLDIPVSDNTNNTATVYSYSGGADVGIPDGAVSSASITGTAAVNNSGSAITRTITVEATLDGCVSASETFTVTVDPTPVIDAIANLSPVCPGEGLNILVTDVSESSNTVYNYSGGADIGIVDGTINGSGSFIIGTAVTNISGTAITRTITVTAMLDGCSYGSETFDVTVSPIPVIAAIADPAAVCPGDPLSINITDNTGSAATAYTYSGGASVGIPDGTITGSGMSITGTAADNFGFTDIVANITVKASLDGCSLSDESFEVTIKPEPSIPNQLINVASCSDVATGAEIDDDPDGPGIATFDMSVALNGLTAAVGNVQPGTAIPYSAGYISGDAFTNTGTGTLNVVYTITPYSAAGCEGNSFDVTVPVDPEPLVVDYTENASCSDVATGAEIDDDPDGPGIATFDMSVAPNGLTAAVGNVQPGTAIPYSAGYISGDAFTNTGTGTLNVVYTITPYSAAGCEGSSFDVTVPIDPEPSIPNQSTLPSVCSGNTINATIPNDTNGPNVSTVDISVSAPGLTAVTSTTGLGLAYAVDIIKDDVYTNVTSGIVDVIYTITPTGGGCVGDAFTITVPVQPEPEEITPAPADVQACSSVTYSFNINDYIANIGTSGDLNDDDLESVIYVWTASAVSPVFTSILTSFGLETSGSGSSSGGTSIVMDEVTNPFSIPITITYTIIPTSSSSCEGDPILINVVLNGSPDAGIGTNGDLTLCQGESRDLFGTVIPDQSTRPSGYTYSWTLSGTATVDTNSDEMVANETTDSPTITAPTTTTGTLIVTFLVTDNATGCSSTVTRTFTVDPNPTAAPATLTTCEDPAGSGNGVFTLSDANSTVFGSQAATDFTVTYHASLNDADMGSAAITTYGGNSTSVFARVTNDDTGCYAVSTVTLMVDPLPTAAIAGDLELCVGESTTLTASGGATYEWSDASTGAMLTDSPTATKDYTVTVTDANGCKSSATVSVTVNPLPVLSIVSDAANNTICPGESVTMDASGTNSFQWTNGPANGSWTVSPEITTTFFVVGTDGNGCSSTASIQIIVRPEPTVTLTDPADVCLDDDNVTLMGTPMGGTFNGPGVTGNIFTPGIAGVGIHTISYELTDANGCTGSDRIEIEVFALPDASFTLQSTTCLDDNPISLTGNGTFTGVGVTGSSFDPAQAGVGTHTITFMVTDANGCTNSSTADIEVLQTPTGASIALTKTAICEGAVTELIFTAGTGVGPFTVVIDSAGTSRTYAGIEDGDVILTTGGNVPVSTGAATQAAYSLTSVTAANGCASAYTQVVTLAVSDSDLGADAGANGTTCAGSVYQTAATVTGGDILWTTNGDGTFNDATTEDPVYTPGSADLLSGVVTLTVTVSGTGACTGNVVSDDLLLSIIDDPDSGSAIAGFETTDTNNDFCLSTGSVDLSAFLSGADAGGTFVIVSGPTGATITGNILDVSGVVSSNASEGFRISYTVGGAAPCPSAVTNLSVYFEVGQFAGSVAGTGYVCSDETTFELFDLLTDATPGGSWQVISTNVGVTLTGSSFDPSTTLFLPGGTTNPVSRIVQFRYTVTGRALCTNNFVDAFVQVNQAATAVVSTSEVNNTVCHDGTAAVSVAIGGSALSGRGSWFSAGDGAFDTQTAEAANYTPGALDVGSTVRLYYVTNDPDGADNGSFPYNAGICKSGIDSVDIIVLAEPVVLASANEEKICSKETPTILISSTTLPAGSVVFDVTAVAGKPTTTGFTTSATIIDPTNVGQPLETGVLVNTGSHIDSVTYTITPRDAGPDGIFDNGDDCRGDDIVVKVMVAPVPDVAIVVNGMTIDTSAANNDKTIEVCDVDGNVIVNGLASYTDASNTMFLLAVSAGNNLTVNGTAVTVSNSTVIVAATETELQGLIDGLVDFRLVDATMPGMVTYTITPVYDWNGDSTYSIIDDVCEGEAISFTIVVNPVPTITVNVGYDGKAIALTSAEMLSDTVCSGAMFEGMVISSTTPAANVFVMVTLDNDDGLLDNQTSGTFHAPVSAMNFPDQMLDNGSNNQQSLAATFTPYFADAIGSGTTFPADACVSEMVEFEITVDPVPNVTGEVNGTLVNNDANNGQTFIVCASDDNVVVDNAVTFTDPDRTLLDISLTTTNVSNPPITVSQLLRFAEAEALFAGATTWTLTDPTMEGSVAVSMTAYYDSNDNGVIDAGECSVDAVTFTVEILPTPTVDKPADQALCLDPSTSTAAVTFTGILGDGSGVSGTMVYDYVITGDAIGQPADGAGTLPAFTPTTAGTITVTVTPTYTEDGGLQSCVGDSESFDITVTPTPTVNDPADQLVCAGETTLAVDFDGSLGDDATYTWTNNNPSIGLGTGATVDIAAFVANNTTTTAQVATIAVTPSYVDPVTQIICTGDEQTFTITVEPVPVVELEITSPTAATLNGSTTALSYTDTVCSPTDFVAVLSSMTASSAGTDVWVQVAFSNPESVPGLPASGTFFAPASAPELDFNLAGVVGPNNAPTTISGTITPYVEDAPGSNDLTGKCVGTPIEFSLTILPTPVADVLSDVTVCDGEDTNTGVVLTSNTTGTIFTVTSSVDIGFGAGPLEVASLADFTAVNTTADPVTAVVTVVPVFTLGTVSCTGDAVSFDYTVNPSTQADPTADQTVCDGGSSAAITFTGGANNTIYEWTNDNTVLVPTGATGTGDIGALTLVNTSTVPDTAEFVVTPVIDNNGVMCAGPLDTFLIIVNPTPMVDLIGDTTLCFGQATNAYVFEGPVAGTTFSYTLSGDAIAMAVPANNGNGTLPAFTPVNTGSTELTATVTVTPSYINAGETCTGPNISFDITIEPEVDYKIMVTAPSQATIDDTATDYIETVCGGDDFTFSPALLTPMSSEGVLWVQVLLTDPLNAFGFGAGTTTFYSPAADFNFDGPLENTTGTSEAITATITPYFETDATASPATADIAGECVGTPLTFSVTVNPEPIAMADPATQRVCSDEEFDVSFTETTGSAATFEWEVTSGLGDFVTTMATTGSGNISGMFINNLSGAQATVTFSVVPTTAFGCTGDAVEFTVEVDPEPVIGVSPTLQFVCSDESIDVTFSEISGIATAVAYEWFIVGSLPDSVTISSSDGMTGTGNVTGLQFNNVSNSAHTINFEAVGTSGGCVGDTIKFSAVVNPEPSVEDDNYTVCTNSKFSINLQDYLNTFGNNVASDFSFVYTPIGEAGGFVLNDAGFVAGDTYSSTDGQIDVNLTNLAAVDLQIRFEVTPTSETGNCVGETFFITVTIEDRVIASINTSGSNTFCSNSEKVIEGNGNQGTQPYTFNWEITATSGSVVGAAIDTSYAVDDGKNATISVDGGSGTITVELIIIDGNGCASEPRVQVLNVTQSPQPTVISGDEEVCGSSNNTYDVTAEAGISYFWQVTSGGTISSSAFGTSVSVDWTSSAGGPHLVIVSRTVGACTTMDTLEVMVVTADADFAFAADPANASGLTYNFTQMTSVANSYAWDFDGLGTSTDADPSFTFPGSGTYEVCLTIDGDCDMDEVCRNVTVTFLPQRVCDSVPMTFGFNIVSTDVIPDDNSIRAVFADLISAGQLNFVQSRNGAGQVITFSPLLPDVLNRLRTIEPGEGYIVSVSDDVTVEICGLEIDPGFRKELHQGINLVAYIPQPTSDIATFLNDLFPGNLTLARDYSEGNFRIFNPFLPPILSSLDSARNAMGYELTLTNPVIEGDWLTNQPEASSREADMATSSYVVVAASTDIPAEYVGHQARVTDANGDIYAFLDVIENGYLMTTPVYENESNTSLEVGTELFVEFRGVRVPLTESFTGDSRVIYKDLSFGFSGTEVTEEVLEYDLRIAPNPFRDEMRIMLKMPESEKVSILVMDMSGRKLMEVISDQVMAEGENTVLLDGRELPTGSYLLQVTVDGSSIFQEQIQKIR